MTRYNSKQYSKKPVSFMDTGFCWLVRETHFTVK